MSEKRKLVLAVDFDGTITNSDLYELKLNKHAKETINYLHDELNCEIIIWTCRANVDSYSSLNDAIKFLKANDIHYDFVNENGSILKVWNTTSRKIFADFYIDDRSFLYEPVNWDKIEMFIEEYKHKYEDIYL